MTNHSSANASDALRAFDQNFKHLPASVATDQYIV